MPRSPWEEDREALQDEYWDDLGDRLYHERVDRELVIRGNKANEGPNEANEGEN